MKPILIVLAFPSLLCADTPADYVNFIRQIQQDTGVEWDVTVSQFGNQIAPTGVSVDGAFFQLWSIHNVRAEEYLLDEQFVTAYTPNATINIATADPYGPVRRTRVDQPFQVQISVVGLLTPADPAYVNAPDAAKWVDYTHAAFVYPEGEHSLAGISNPAGTLIDEGYMEETADTTVTFSVTNLPGADLTLTEGEEVFTISAQADFGVSATILDSKKVQIWPVAQASMTGIDPNVYYEQIPPITVVLKDLYPASTTYMRVSPVGAPPTSPEVKVVTASYVVIEDSIPQDRTLVLSDLDRYFTTEGFHNIEVLHETPFGTDILASWPIRVDRTVEVTGTIYASEQ